MIFEIGQPIIIHVPDIQDWTNAVILNRRPALNQRRHKFEYIVSTPFYIHKWIPLGPDNLWDASKLKHPPQPCEPPHMTNMRWEDLPLSDVRPKYVNEWEYVGILSRQNPIIPEANNS